MKQITNKEYFADKSYWHQSSLKSLLSNPILAIESKLGLNEISSSSLNKGNATHFLVLGVGDPITSASELGFKDFRTKEARQVRDEKINEGYVILNDTQWLESQYAADAVFANPLYKVVDKAQYKECAVYGELNGVKVAAKPDAVYIYEEDGVKKAHIIDIKTSKDILGDDYGSLQGFDKAVWNMGYYFQVPSYKLLVSLDQDIAIENIDFTFLTAENTLRDGLDKPLCCAYTLSKEYEDYGTKCLQDALETAKDLQNKNLEEVLENLKKEKQDKKIQLAKQFDNSNKEVQLPAWVERL